MTQKTLLVKKLAKRTAIGVTTKEAQDWGVLQPRKRVYDLRQEGYEIATNVRFRKGKREHFYTF